jgi:hypothetical protein
VRSSAASFNDSLKRAFTSQLHNLPSIFIFFFNFVLVKFTEISFLVNLNYSLLEARGAVQSMTLAVCASSPGASVLRVQRQEEGSKTRAVHTHAGPNAAS